MRSRAWLSSEAGALLSGGYPSFIYGGRHEGSGYLPVFLYHTIDREEFDRGLRYLQENDYTTLTLDQALAWMQGEIGIPSRSVVLTIDDGRMTTWTTGYPLLEARGMTATAFVIPGYLEDGPPRPTLDPSEGTDPDPALIPSEESDRRTSLRWSEVRALHESGVISIESHTMLHRRVEISERLAGFLDPDMLKKAPHEVPMPHNRRRRWKNEEMERRLGTPIFDSIPILGAPTACVLPELPAGECRARVADAGGGSFFEESGWRRELEDVVRRSMPVGRLPRCSLYEEQRWELEQSKRALEEVLPGKRVRHLALPEGTGSAGTADLVRECGYDSCLWSWLPSSSTNRRGTSPYRIGRIKNDYIFSLPGRRRRSLPRVLLGKSLRRARGRTGY